MKIFKVKKVFEIAYAHRLFKYNGKCENLHGHNAKIEITLQSKNLDSQTMVKDFMQIKKIAGKWLDDNLDHATLLHKKDPLAKILKQHNQKIFLLDKNPTAEFIALVVKDSLKRIGLNVKSVILWENSTSMAEVKEE